MTAVGRAGEFIRACRHAELGSASSSPLSGSLTSWTLNQVQGDGLSGPSALARLEAAVRLVDDVGAAPAADHAAVAMARLEGFERVADLHGLRRLPVLSNFRAGK